MSTSVLQEGDAAPDFTAPRDGGGEFALADHADKVVVLFFYPKADTSGCTKEAIAFSESMAAFEAAGALPVGISKDPVTKQDKFKEKHGLGMILLSDENGTICEDFGVWVEKSMYGKKYMGIERATFAIKGGKVVKAWHKVKVPGHVDAVLEAVRAL